MTGRPLLTRLAFGLRRPRNPIPGLDVAGVVDSVVDRTFPLDRAADAIAHLANGHTRGKTALTINRLDHR